MPSIIRFARAGGPEVLIVENVDLPIPASQEVRIKVKAIGINRAEAMWRENAYLEPVIFPARLGYEAAGIVDAIGGEITTFSVGDTVNVIPSFSMNKYGTYGDFVLVPVTAIIKQPVGLTYEEAASAWMMYITAYSALVDDAKLTHGDAVVISAASSSVGLAAIQIANLKGAVTIALTRTSSKRQQLIDAGAKHVIVTEEQDLVSEVNALTDGKGVRVVFDPVGGPAFPKLMAITAARGVLYLYGALSDEATNIPALEMIRKALTIKGHSMSRTTGDPDRRKAALAFISAGLSNGTLKPFIDRTFRYDEIVEAHRHMEQNGQFGKIVVTV
jgi:NADPH:quinone reductase-like Zn-dependent oxidoreductase